MKGEVLSVRLNHATSSHHPDLTFDLNSVPELVKPPELNQARVNKCLIALVNRKLVQKDNSTVRVLHGLRDIRSYGRM